MKTNLKFVGIVLCLYLLINFQSIVCQVRLPHLISNGMMLQRNTNLKIWGWASTGETVTLKFNNKTYQGVVKSDGKWSIILTPQQAVGPYIMDISASNHITINNIVIGDVWVCSGQSNMELPMEVVKVKYPEVIAKSENQNIRQFYVPHRYVFKETQEDVQLGRWESANPESVLRFTAVGYFFARDLFEKYHVPIGLINSSLGGSPIEAWLSEDALKKFPTFMETAEKCKDSAYVDKIKKDGKTAKDEWFTRLRQLDKGYTKSEVYWSDTSCNISSWPVIQLPGFWADGNLGSVNGAVWFRKEVEVPASMTGKPAKLILGRIVDSDSTYINGTFVGTSQNQYIQRTYNIPANLLKAGKNNITIRVVNYNGRGGFVKDKPYQIEIENQIVDLKGEWQYNLGTVINPFPGTTFFPYKPLGLFNGMISPLLQYAIKGVIWYQGESNTGNPPIYAEMFPALIEDWRQKWNQGSFPFLYVQLPNFQKAQTAPSESNWAEIKEIQRRTLAVSNTGMAVTHDIGEWNDIHPLNKEDVGKRLSLAAQKVAYNEKKIVYSGPLYQSMKINKNQVIITFTNTDSGLMAKGGSELKYFSIAGADKKFVWAKAKIDGNKVIIWNDQITNPVAVRYAWADNPDGANLYNKEGLPASSFKTD